MAGEGCDIFVGCSGGELVFRVCFFRDEGVVGRSVRICMGLLNVVDGRIHKQS